MEQYFLEFEEPIIKLDEKIQALTTELSTNANNKKALEELDSLQKKKTTLMDKIYSELSPFDTVKLARHPNRPHASDYIANIFQDFDELKGDRTYGDDKAVITGIGYLDETPVAIIGSEKGFNMKEKIAHNFGMISPEGYAKTLRVMQLAERFKMPVITFIDIPGAYPGISAEERNQSYMIANNLQKMSALKTPIICNVIGEGGSGGALSIGVGDIVNMLEYSIYSVISPEGCAAILYKDAAKANVAAESLGLTAKSLQSLGIIDNIIKEPKTGAQSNKIAAATNLKEALVDNLDYLQQYSIDKLLARRYERLMKYGY